MWSSDDVQKLTAIVYNYNAYVGTVPAGPSDALDSDALAGFSKGLKVACEAKPSLSAGGGAPSIQTASPVSYTILPAFDSASTTQAIPVSIAPVIVFLS